MATHTESFNKANAATLGPDLTWTEVVGTQWGVTSNAASVQGGATGNDNHARAEHDVAGADHYVEATLTVNTLPAGAGFRAAVGGVMARFDSASDSCLCFQAETTGTNQQYGLRRWVNAVESAQIAAHTQSPAVGDRLRIECEGSTVRCYVNDILLITHTGEAIITSGTRGGLRGILVGNAGTGAFSLDDFEVGDLGGAPVSTPTFLTLGVGR